MADDKNEIVSPFARKWKGQQERERKKEKKIIELIDRVIDYPLPPRPMYEPKSKTKEVRLDREKRRLLTVLHRDTEKLLLASLDGQLTKDNSDTLVKYLKLVHDLEKAEKAEEADLSDEQLEKIAQGKKP